MRKSIADGAQTRCTHRIPDQRLLQRFRVALVVARVRVKQECDENSREHEHCRQVQVKAREEGASQAGTPQRRQREDVKRQYASEGGDGSKRARPRHAVQYCCKRGQDLEQPREQLQHLGKLQRYRFSQLRVMRLNPAPSSPQRRGKHSQGH